MGTNYRSGERECGDARWGERNETKRRNRDEAEGNKTVFKEYRGCVRNKLQWRGQSPLIRTPPTRTTKPEEETKQLRKGQQPEKDNNPDKDNSPDKDNNPSDLLGTNPFFVYDIDPCPDEPDGTTLVIVCFQPIMVSAVEAMCSIYGGDPLRDPTPAERRVGLADANEVIASVLHSPVRPS